ncbi:hypothetical protein [Streptomyces sp. NPDC046862]|uniref:hypothetical protein n=1 Tax=Streptomyces sp. NPDC046862 TaxID=3154603 RepID=UPI003456CFA3
MTTRSTPHTPHTPVNGSTPAPAFDEAVHAADMSGAVMAASSGDFIAGLIAYGQLASVGSPRALVAGLLPEMDPEMRQELIDRLLAIGFHAGRLSVRPQFHGEDLARVQDKLARAGFNAMAGQVGRSLRTVAPTRAGRGEVDGGSGREG